jgi:hypothetical protein
MLIAAVCCLICVIAATDGASTELKINQRMETLLKQQNIMDQPEITRVLFHPTRTRKNPPLQGPLTLNRQSPMTLPSAAACSAIPPKPPL